MHHHVHGSRHYRWNNFQSPIHRGRGCIPPSEERKVPWGRLSVPYSSGPWLHQLSATQTTRTGGSFSPLFIGAVVASVHRPAGEGHVSSFQSPIHRGRGCILPPCREGRAGCSLSVPYSSGPWLHHDRGRRTDRKRSSFSPLFIGAVVAS